MSVLGMDPYRNAAPDRIGVGNATTEAPYPDGNPKTAMGMAKPSTSNVPPIGILEVGKVMALGAKKYGPMNWRHQGVSASVYYDAIQRHLAAYWDGEDCDSESGAPHIAHVAACCMILLDAQAQMQLNDNRPAPGPASFYIAANTAKKEIA